MAFNFEQIMADWPGAPTVGSAQIPDVGFPGLTGTQTIPTVQPGFFNQGNRRELIAMALDQLGRGITGQRGPGLGTTLAQSSIASKAAQRQVGALTPADRDGDTKRTVTSGPAGTNYDIETTVRNIPKPDLGRSLEGKDPF